MVWGGCWHNLNKLFFKPWSSQKRRCLHARTHTLAHTPPHTLGLSVVQRRASFQSLFPRGFWSCLPLNMAKASADPVKSEGLPFLLFPLSPRPVFLKHRYASCSLLLLPSQPNYLPLLFWCSRVVWRSSYSATTLISFLLSREKVSDDSRLSLEIDFNVPREFYLGLKMPGAITHVQTLHNSSNEIQKKQHRLTKDFFRRKGVTELLIKQKMLLNKYIIYSI